MKIGRVRFDGKLADNVITENLLQPNYLVYNLDLHCIFWSDIGLQRVRILFITRASFDLPPSLFPLSRFLTIAWIQVIRKYSM